MPGRRLAHFGKRPLVEDVTEIRAMIITFSVMSWLRGHLPVFPVRLFHASHRSIPTATGRSPVFSVCDMISSALPCRGKPFQRPTRRFIFSLLPFHVKSFAPVRNLRISLEEPPIMGSMHRHAAAKLQRGMLRLLRGLPGDAAADPGQRDQRMHHACRPPAPLPSCSRRNYFR